MTVVSGQEIQLERRGRSDRLEVAVIMEQFSLMFNGGLGYQQINRAADGQPFGSAFPVHDGSFNIRIMVFEGEYGERHERCPYLAKVPIIANTLQHFGKRYRRDGNIRIAFDQRLNCFVVARAGPVQELDQGAGVKQDHGGFPVMLQDHPARARHGGWSTAVSDCVV